MIQPLKFNEGFETLSIGSKFHTNMWKTEVGTFRLFVIYCEVEKGVRKYVSVEGLRVGGSSDFEGKDPWVITKVYNEGVTSEPLSLYEKEKIDYSTLF